MSPRAMAVARYSFHTNLRTPLTWAGAALVPGIPLLGAGASLLQGEGWRLDESLVALGFVFGSVFVLRSGLVEHRTSGLTEFLRQNFIRARTHVGGAILAILATWLLLGGWAFLTVLLLTGGDAGDAAWVALILTLRLGALLPFVVLVELVADLRTPLFLPGLVYFAALFLAALFLGVEEAVSLFQLQTDRAFPRSSLPLVFRAATIMGLGFPILLAGTAIRNRGRLRRRAAGE